MKIILIITVTFSLLFTTSSYSYEIISPSSEYEHMKIPNYCIVKPSDSQFDEEQKDWMVKMAQHAIEEWNSNLQENFNYSYKWQLTSTPISNMDQASNFKCDWILSFQNKESFFLTHEVVLGYTDNIRQEINIMFSKSNEDKLHDVLLHEIGHSLRLEDFTIEEYQTMSKNEYSESNPSIMIADIHTHPGSTHITQMDIDKIKSVYGEKGILMEYERENENISSELDSINILESVNVSSEKTIVKKYQPNMLTISGKLKKNSVLSGVPLHIITTNPDLCTCESKIQLTSSGQFQIPLIFDQDSMKGEYSIELMYRGHIISHQSVKYWVEDEFSTQSTQKTVEKPKETTSWIKNNAKWWAEGLIDDSSFVQGIQFLIKEGIVNISIDSQNIGSISSGIPAWVHNNAGWWAEGLIDDSSFIQGIEYLVKQEIIKVN